MRAAVLALVLLVGCAPTYRLVTKRCPPTTMLLSDFVLAGAALAVSTIKWNAEKQGESLAYTSGAGAVYLGANWAEVTCKH